MSAVERVLDAAHALMSHGVHRYPAQAQARTCAPRSGASAERREHGEQIFNDLWRTVPTGAPASRTGAREERRRALLGAAAGEPPLFPGEDGAAAAALAARDPAHRPPRSRSISIRSADQGDERGLRHLLSTTGS